MAGLLFLDNDAILKLVACNLFWEAVASLELSSGELRVLFDAKYVFQKSRRIIQDYPQSVRDSAILVVEQCTPIERGVVDELPGLEIEKIDFGERVLIAATLNTESFYLATGDKQCLKAIASAPGLEEIRKRLRGRVICLEQLILKLIRTEDFDKILANVLPARECDDSLKAIFGSGEKATQENVSLALEGYIEDLRKNTGELLAEI